MQSCDHKCQTEKTSVTSGLNINSVCRKKERDTIRLHQKLDNLVLFLSFVKNNYISIFHLVPEVSFDPTWINGSENSSRVHVGSVKSLSFLRSFLSNTQTYWHLLANGQNYISYSNTDIRWNSCQKVCVFLEACNHVLPSSGRVAQETDGEKPVHTWWAHTGRMEGKQSREFSLPALSASEWSKRIPSS